MCNDGGWWDERWRVLIFEDNELDSGFAFHGSPGGVGATVRSAGFAAAGKAGRRFVEEGGGH